jgi:YD repeat-containing protein
MRLASPALWLPLALGCGEPTPKDKVPTDTGPVDADDPETCTEQAPDHWPGCLIQQSVDPDGDGRAPTVVRTQYDGQGRRVSEDTRQAVAFDEWTLCGTDWLADAGFPTLEWCIGRSTYAYAWTHDADGHPATKVYDAGWDGEPDKAWTFVTDSEGRILESAQDQDLDGVTDSLNRFTYDEAGHVLTESWDYDADGTDDYVRSYRYDPQSGALVSEETDSDADGAADKVVTWARDAEGRALERIEDEGADGLADLRTEYTWTDCKLTEAEETDLDGNVTVTLYAYDAAHRLAVEETDNGADDEIDARTEWQYTCPF